MLTTMKRILLSLAGLLLAASLFAQNSFVHGQSDGYVWPDDPAVLEKLDRWQDLKFGVLMPSSRNWTGGRTSSSAS